MIQFRILFSKFESCSTASCWCYSSVYTRASLLQMKNEKMRDKLFSFSAWKLDKDPNLVWVYVHIVHINEMRDASSFSPNARRWLGYVYMCVCAYMRAFYNIIVSIVGKKTKFKTTICIFVNRLKLHKITKLQKGAGHDQQNVHTTTAFNA